TPLSSAEDKDGRVLFSGTVLLPRGNHKFRFVVDGEWRHDPKVNRREPEPEKLVLRAIVCAEQQYACFWCDSKLFSRVLVVFACLEPRHKDREIQA
ncbi:unnamed protein product, partial [Ectocarpus sp. 8 AP-2014]